MAASEKDGESRKGRKGAFRLLEGDGAAESPGPGEPSRALPSSNPLMPGSNLHLGWVQPSDTRAGQSHPTPSTGTPPEPGGAADTQPSQTARQDPPPASGRGAERQKRTRVVVLGRSPTSAVPQAPTADRPEAAELARREARSEDATPGEQSSAGVPGITPDTTQGRFTETGDAAPVPDEAGLEKKRAATLPKWRRRPPGHRPWRRLRGDHPEQQRPHRRRHVLAAASLLAGALTFLVVGSPFRGPAGRSTRQTSIQAQNAGRGLDDFLLAAIWSPVTRLAPAHARTSRPPAAHRPARRPAPPARAATTSSTTTATAAATGSSSTASPAAAAPVSTPASAPSSTPQQTYTSQQTYTASQAGPSPPSAQTGAEQSSGSSTSSGSPGGSRGPSGSSGSSGSRANSRASGKFSTFGPGY